MDGKGKSKKSGNSRSSSSEVGDTHRKSTVYHPDLHNMVPNAGPVADLQDDGLQPMDSSQGSMDAFADVTNVINNEVNPKSGIYWLFLAFLANLSIPPCSPMSIDPSGERSTFQTLENRLIPWLKEVKK